MGIAHRLFPYCSGGESMSKKAKIGSVVALVALIAIMVVVAVVNKGTSDKGEKTVTIEVISERDGLNESETISTDYENVGEILHDLDYCSWEESSYGTYVTGFYDKMEDIDNQYWWCFIVNGETSVNGVDSQPVADGDVYTFQLVQGW